MENLSFGNEIANVLGCPVCKSSINADSDIFVPELQCKICDTQFPVTENGVPDFRLIPPHYSQKQFHAFWEQGQTAYESWSKNRPTEKEYFEQQIRSCNFYHEFVGSLDHCKGVLLDVGGNDGRLLHWFKARDRYVSVDPFLTVREDLLSPARLSCYPSLAKPCNFLCGRVEYLPIKNSSIDFVWCASVLDQVWDPFGSLLEIRRVLKPDGKFFLVTHIQKSTGGRKSTSRSSKITRFF
jgi:SAM-dependent methyltransferase